MSGLLLELTASPHMYMNEISCPSVLRMVSQNLFLEPSSPTTTSFIASAGPFILITR